MVNADDSRDANPWLENEIADVITGIELVEKRFGLMRLEGRIAKKTKHLSQWHNLA